MTALGSISPNTSKKVTLNRTAAHDGTSLSLIVQRKENAQRERTRSDCQNTDKITCK